MALTKRIIAIQMLPKAYDEIQRLRGESDIEDMVYL